MEEFRKIGIKDYEVSNLGNVRNNGKLLKPITSTGGYKVINFWFGKKNHQIRIHRLVAKCFPEICGEWWEGCQIDHLNTIRSDNRACNLRVCDAKQNCNNPLTKQKQAEYQRSMPQEKRDKISRTLKGHPVSEETRRKIGDKQRNIPKEKLGTPYARYTMSGEFIERYPSASWASKMRKFCLRGFLNHAQKVKDGEFFEYKGELWRKMN